MYLYLKHIFWLGACRWAGLVGRTKIVFWRLAIPVISSWQQRVIFRRIARRIRDGETYGEARLRAVKTYIRWCDIKSTSLDRKNRELNREYRAFLRQGASDLGMTPEEFERFVDSVTR